MRRFFPWIADFVVDRPRTVFALIGMMCGIAIVGYADPGLVTRWLSPPPAEETTEPESAASEDYEPVPANVDPVSLTDSDAIVLVRSDSFFTPAGARTMRGVVTDLESLPYVRRILWMDRIPTLNLFGLPEPLLPRASASPGRFEAAEQKALEHPLLAGQLLSTDAKYLLLLVQFDFLFLESDRDCTEGLRDAAEQFAKKWSEGTDAKFEFQVTGRVPLTVALLESRDANTLKYQIIAYSMIAVMAVLLFRGIFAVLIVAIAPALGVFWSLGIIRFFELQDNPFNQVVVPVLISLVALTDGVHLMVQIRKRRAEGMPPREAARVGLSEVGLACFLTSLTTAIGFASLLFSHSQIVREFGTSCVIGVTITFLAVVLTIPLACTSWLGKRMHQGHGKGVIDRNIGSISRLVDVVMLRYRSFGLIAICATVGLLVVSSTLRPDERLSNRFPTSSAAVQGLFEMDRAFGGLEMGHVDVNWRNDVPPDSGEILQVMRKVDQLLRSEEQLGTPISICNLLDALPGEGLDADRMSMLDLLPPPLKRAFYTPEYRSARTSFRCRDIGIAAYGPVFERIELELKEIHDQHPLFSLELTGNPVRRWRDLYRVVVDLALSLGTATVIIFFVLALVYRSLTIGLISLVPNLFPLAVTGTFLVATGQMLELVSVCAFTVCLGIAVDDTIHFMTRFVEERGRNKTPEAALRTAFTTVGTSLIMTTVVLCAGFATVLWSDAREHRIFGAMSGLTIASALFADLVFLPALLRWFTKQDKTDAEPKEDDSSVAGQP